MRLQRLALVIAIGHLGSHANAQNVPKLELTKDIYEQVLSNVGNQTALNNPDSSSQRIEI
jgi:hypothetical protein